jgi:predicted transcriptional regulator
LGRLSVERTQELKREAIQLTKTNPTLSHSQIAKHIGVSQPTVSRYLANLKTCNTKLNIEKYGGGIRYACPKCDSNGSSISWINNTPKFNNCSNLI